MDGLESALFNVAALFGCMKDKARFIEHYHVFVTSFRQSHGVAQMYLARRLLEGTSRSEVAERFMLSRLKAEGGVSVEHLESMLLDVHLSAEFNTKLCRKLPCQLSSRPLASVSLVLVFVLLCSIACRCRTRRWHWVSTALASAQADWQILRVLLLSAPKHANVRAHL